MDAPAAQLDGLAVGYLLGLLVGERAASDLVRTGAERATVEGVFEVGDAPDLMAALDARGIETEDGTLVLKREVASTGTRARAWINGSPVTTSVLADIGRLLVNVHGQHEAQALLVNLAKDLAAKGEIMLTKNRADDELVY